MLDDEHKASTGAQSQATKRSADRARATSRTQAVLDRVWREERREVVKAVLVGTALLAALCVFYYALIVPAERREVVGSIVTFKNSADDGDQIHWSVAVRLDDGRTTWARVDGHVPLRVGRRVVLLETTTALIGWRRYRFHRFEDEPTVGRRDPEWGQAD